MFPDVDDTTGLVRRPEPRPFPLGPPTIAAILDQPAATTPDLLALIDRYRSWTYTQLDQAVNEAAAALWELGTRPGDRVAWTLPNCAELPIGYLACHRIGAVWLGINAALTVPERQYLLDDAEVGLYIADHAGRADPDDGGDTGRDDGWSPAGTADLVMVAGAEWAARCADSTGEAPHVDIDPHAPAAIAYTSGTTGLPKGAVHSQHNLLWPGLISISTHPPVEGERQGTPLAHTILNMLVLGAVAAWARGTTGVVLHHTDAAGFSAEVLEHKITRTTIVPTMAHDLVHRSEIGPDALATLGLVIIGGAGTPAPLRRAFAEKFGLRAIVGYGLSEAPTGLVRESPDEPIDDVATGYAMEPFEVVIVDSDSDPESDSASGAGGGEPALPPGSEGEICIRATTSGPWADCWTPTLGYWKRPDATRELLRNGLLHTGDIGSLDEQGRLTISGRRSELILRGAANVYPVEVETVMANHPDVGEVAVLGVADDRLGQRVAAVITASIGTPAPDLDSIRRHCAGQLAGYKVPNAIVVVASLPRNAMGKVQKSELVSSVETATAEFLRTRSSR